MKRRRTALRRSFALLLVTLMALFALAACGSNQKDNAANNAANGSGSSSVTPNGSGSMTDNDAAGRTENEGTLDNGAASGSGSAASQFPAENGTAGSANGTTRSQSPVVRGANDVIQGTERMVRDTGNAIRNTGEAVERTSGQMIRGATYEEMLRNGRVHDADGNLYDYENAMTPGTRYF